jgi:hypothetical protein
MKGSRFRILLLALAGILGTQASAQSPSLLVERHDGYLRVSAPQLHFLTGRALDRLHDGSTVTYAITLTAVAERSKKPAFLLQERFAVSFDLWEEKYSVVQIRQDGRAASRLTAAMAEAWCLENMPIPVPAVPDRQPFVIRLECSIDASEAENGSISGSGLTLAGLIDVFSRKRNEEPLRWQATSGPLRLSDLKSDRQSQ